MMRSAARLTGGFYKGATLLTDRSGAIRSTGAIAREALFSILREDEIAGRDFLDLYSGAGIVGLEAFSRFASTVTLIERAPGALKLIERNIAKLSRIANAKDAPSVARIKLIADSVENFARARRDEWKGRRYDFIFADAPWDQIASVEPFLLARLPALARPGGKIIIERPARARRRSETPSELKALSNRRYGDIELDFYRRV